MLPTLQWKDGREELVQQGTKFVDVLSKSLTGSSKESSIPGTGCIQRGYEMLEKRFDEQLGGFGNAPKFPQPSMCIGINFGQ